MISRSATSGHRSLAAGRAPAGVGIGRCGPWSKYCGAWAGARETRCGANASTGPQRSPGQWETTPRRHIDDGSPAPRRAGHPGALERRGEVPPAVTHHSTIRPTGLFFYDMRRLDSDIGALSASVEVMSHCKGPCRWRSPCQTHRSREGLSPGPHLPVRSALHVPVLPRQRSAGANVPTLRHPRHTGEGSWTISPLRT